jgi:DNA polymerase/3'-5' exonuclease PolX
MNADIVDMLERMMRLRVEQGEAGKVHGYVRAIRALQAWPQRITSASEALNVPGIGPSMSARIGEFLTTGRVAELASVEDKERVIKLFLSVDRVGEVRAEEWYRAGYRRLEDIPQSAATAAQWIGIQLHGDLIQKIPRAEIDLFKILFAQFLWPKGIRFEICGSYRRGRLSSGDIDVLVIDEPGRSIMSEVLQWPYFTHSLASGPKKFMGVLRLPVVVQTEPSSRTAQPGPEVPSGQSPGVGLQATGQMGLYRRIDVELVQPNEYPYAVTYFTGTASFNVKMRDHCRLLGLRLNEKSLLNSQGQPIIVQSEQNLFEVLGLQYLTPEERDKY